VQLEKPFCSKRDKPLNTALREHSELRTRIMKTEATAKTLAGPWDAAVAQLREWDPTWADTCVKMSNNPWTNGVLPRKFMELVSIALNVACTNLNPDGTRRHIRAALDAGAKREEILTIFKMASVMSIHSCSLGAPILLEEAKAAGVSPMKKNPGPTPACDVMRTVGQWNTAWDPFFALDPEWTDEFMATGGSIYGGGLFSPKEIELLSIASPPIRTCMRRAHGGILRLL
jgi:alkylhydroperoxidase/carboxymuconolactone decarboxylase family protein YurZ